MACEFFVSVCSRLVHALTGTGGCCRFTPTCSQYVGQVLARFGLGRGLLLALARLFRCHPWGGSGFDPIPSK